MSRNPAGDPLRFRRRALLGVWLLCGAAVVARAAQVQLVQGDAWAQAALAQQRTSIEIPAPRGRILDREGVPLAETRELVEVGVAPREIRDREQAASTLSEALGLSRERARRVVSSGRSWEYLGAFPTSVRPRLKDVTGVHLTRLLRRDYPQGQLARGILGSVRDGLGAGGLEQTFEDLLRGHPGRAVLGKDPSGRLRGGQVFQMEAPRAGGDLVLTLDADLQAIAKESLAAAVDSTEATGGDILVLSPHTGEILAAASLRGGVDAGLGFITEPVEPGSTMKPFTLATLLRRGRASLADEFDVGEGRWTQCGRTIHDVSARGTLTLERAVQVSSNVAVARAAEALTPLEQWEGLRDFGFGQATGLPVPGESSGRLRRPDEWTCQSRASLAIGYEISVTPLQVALAYGALANGGRLMEPRIVQEVRHPDGRRESVAPRVVRRVVSRRLAREITEVLVGVVADGTGQAARLASFNVAAKSGTARAFGDGAYERGSFYSSFVGYFPAEDPQLVIYAKLDNVAGYGGALAGPVTRAMMEAALASQGTPLRFAELSDLTRPDRSGAATGASVRFAATTLGNVEPEAPVTVRGRSAGAAGPTGVDLFAAPPAASVRRPSLSVRVPDLSGMGLREASRTLHALGLRVRVESGGPVSGTRPRAGSTVTTGDTILLRSGRADR
ncbi:MAG: penicillin-binding transpeptidase domain-containing protein [Longimicrobiales bacterium]|nr:penicillin-binding transpeptidase domain-containing protein [Longimicrobiales bacterium]